MKQKGFTLVELIIVIVIVGILSIVAVPIYKGYVEKAKITEGKALVSAIRTAQSVYYAEHGAWYACASTQYNDVLGIDARSNKYYTTFATGLGNGGVVWHATAVADSDNSMGLNWSVNGEPVSAEGQTTPYFYYITDGKVSFSRA